MEPWIQIIITVFSSVLASSGLWAYVVRKSEYKDIKTEMLIGLAHDRIIYLGNAYIDRHAIDGKGITIDEYENLNDYLYKPYKRMGGNGSAERIMKEIDKLPIHSNV